MDELINQILWRNGIEQLIIKARKINLIDDEEGAVFLEASQRRDLTEIGGQSLTHPDSPDPGTLMSALSLLVAKRSSKFKP